MGSIQCLSSAVPVIELGSRFARKEMGVKGKRKRMNGSRG